MISTTNTHENLLLSGNWIRPAMEVLTTTISGLQAAKMILIREGLSEPLEDIGIKKGVMK